jgi:hypothetical protein
VGQRSDGFGADSELLMLSASDMESVAKENGDAAGKCTEFGEAIKSAGCVENVGVVGTSILSEECPACCDEVGANRADDTFAGGTAQEVAGGIAVDPSAALAGVEDVRESVVLEEASESSEETPSGKSIEEGADESR